MTLLAINTNRTQTIFLNIPRGADRYTLTAQKLEDSQVWLNGHELKLENNDDVPSLAGVRISPGRVDLAPVSITFLAITEAGNPNCE